MLVSLRRGAKHFSPPAASLLQRPFRRQPFPQAKREHLAAPFCARQPPIGQAPATGHGDGCSSGQNLRIGVCCCSQWPHNKRRYAQKSISGRIRGRAGFDHSRHRPRNDPIVRTEDVHVVANPDRFLDDEKSDQPMHRADEASKSALLARLDLLPTAPRALLHWRSTGCGDHVRPVAFAAGELPYRGSDNADRVTPREVTWWFSHVCGSSITQTDDDRACQGSVEIRSARHTALDPAQYGPPITLL